MRTEEERFEEWWEKEYPGMAEGFGSRDSWLARAALDRPKLGCRISLEENPRFPEYLCDGYSIDDDLAKKLLGERFPLKLGEEVEV